MNELLKGIEIWYWNVDQLVSQLIENVSLIVGRQEQSRIRAAELHAIIDFETDKAIQLITIGRQTAHINIEDGSRREIDFLQCQLTELEESLELCHEQRETISNVLSMGFNSTSPSNSSKTEQAPVNVSSVYSSCHGTEMVIADVTKLTDLKTQWHQRIKDHIETVRDHIISLHKKIVEGPVALNRTRCDELQALLNTSELFTVSNKRVWRGPIPPKEDAMVMLISIFEKQGICEQCFGRSGRGDGGETRTTEADRCSCVSCGVELSHRNGNLVQRHTINRGAGVIDGQGSSAQGAFSKPLSVALITTDTDKLLFVADTEHHKVKVFNSETGQYMRKLKNVFGRPVVLASLILHNDHDSATHLLFVGNYDISRLNIVDVGHGDAPMGFISISATGLAAMTCQVHGATVYYLYVSSRTGHQVLVFDVKSLKQVDGFGSNQLYNPQGLALLPSHISDMPESVVFVCDEGNRKIFLFDALSGQFISTIGGEDLLRKPRGATISSSLDHTDHTLIITDIELHKIFLFDAITGNCLRSIGSQGTAIDQLCNPCDVAAIRDDNDHIIIYTADTCNYRVQISVD